MRIRIISTLGALALSLAVAPSARADGFVEPFAGVTFGGTADTHRYVYGGRVGFIGNVAGFEADFGYAPNFFSGSDKFGDFQGKLNITTLMGNLLIGGAPMGSGGVRPYLVGGFGLMRGLVSSPNDLFSDVTRNDFALDVGGGLQGYFNQHVGPKSRSAAPGWQGATTEPYWAYAREKQRRQPGCPARDLGDGTRFQGTSEDDRRVGAGSGWRSAGW